MCDKGERNPQSTSSVQSSYRPRFSKDSPEHTDKMEDKDNSKENKPLSQNIPVILDPDDPLMKRFQDALKAHLTRVNDKLNQEILELEATFKLEEKNRETKGLTLYNAQQEIASQEAAIEKYEKTLFEIIKLREEREEELKKAKESHKETSEKLREEKTSEEKLLGEIESLASLEKQFAEWEQELANNLIICQRMSEKDAIIQRELIHEKQREDYILFKLMQEVWKVENEIKSLDEQLQLKEKEKMAAKQVISDANADLEAVQREHKNLFATWNSVIISIGQRDRVNQELNEERRKIRESFYTLQAQIEKLKKDTGKEMENNERLTLLQSRVEEDVQHLVKTISIEKDKLNNLESQLIRTTRLVEQSQAELAAGEVKYQQYVNEEKLIDKDLDKLASQKVMIEDEIIAKLEEKIINNKAARHLNKLLRDAKEGIREQELLVVQAENAYAKTTLETERLNTIIANTKIDLDEIAKDTLASEKEIDKMTAEIRKCEVIITKKQRTIALLNKKIEEALATTGGEEISPLDVKIMTLEKNIDEIEQKNQKSQNYWLRQEGYIVTLSQQRNMQLQEINLLNKQITIMEQKNLKLEHELEKEKKEEANMNRTINLFQQKLLQINNRLASQKELKNELEDKNCLIKNEYMKSLQDAEMDIIRLQNQLKDLENEKIMLKDQLNALQRESLSWEKKVNLACETIKRLKNERAAGGDVAVMKSEIHKMEIRLLHLKKVQEKLVQDMEFCVARRDVIVDGVMAKQKRNPKSQQYQKIIFRKRLDDQSLKIKKLTKELKQIENKVSVVEKQQKEMLEKLNEGQNTLREIEDVIPDIDKQIMEAELIKHQNLESLIRKQHKIKMLESVRDGRYKILFKSESALNEELQKQRIMNFELKAIMEQTKQDFPLLKDSIDTILLTLEMP
ncbi:coiled-coil domain-containing protein 40 [Cephus cinctus]|uniref:Coiled-coil domain-containing protein 40 n=1 Tax=Cephus cinctus TaxID=211228 RepID=A0AAJ7FJZ3_CEPCN|nr:coiled-coil domain-containing protein 40 [Cephus cinctus]